MGNFQNPTDLKCRCGTKMLDIYDTAGAYGICVIRWCPECGMLGEQFNAGPIKNRWREPARNIRARLERESQQKPDPEPNELLKEKGAR